MSMFLNMIDENHFRMVICGFMLWSDVYTKGLVFKLHRLPLLAPGLVFTVFLPIMPFSCMPAELCNTEAYCPGGLVLDTVIQ